MSENDKSIPSLIPDYVNGTLSLDNKRIVETAAENDPSIAAEIEIYRSIGTAVKSGTDDYEPGAMGWARLSKAINQEERNLTSAPKFSVPVSGLWRYAAAILGIVALGQSLLLINQGGQTDEQSTYITASESITAQNILKVAFVATSNEIAIRELLRSVDGNIVSGPSAIGLYELKFSDEKTMSTAREKLAEAKDIIESVMVN